MAGERFCFVIFNKPKSEHSVRAADINHFQKGKKIKTLILFIFTILLTAMGQTLADSWFSDNFNDGLIDTTHWQYSSDGITESGGSLNLNRSSNDDSIQTAYTYSGDFVINLDIRLNYMNSNDALHGLTVTDIMNPYDYTGVSMGFSLWDKLYCGVPLSGGTRFYYGDGTSNMTGQWQHWTLTKNGNYLSILVNGKQVAQQKFGFTFGGPVPDTVRVYFPGFYDSEGSSGNGITSSDIDNFSITPIPEPATLLLLGLGAVIIRKKYHCN